MAQPQREEAAYYADATCSASASAAPVYGQPAVPQIHLMQPPTQVYNMGSSIVVPIAAQGYPAMIYPPAPAYPQPGSLPDVREWDGGICSCCDRRDDRFCITCW